MNRTASSLIHNIGTLVSGDIRDPVLPYDSVLVRNGLIERIGSYRELRGPDIDLEIDIRGMTLCPGLIDAHTHPNIGDWAPVMKSVGWMENALQAGVTTLISQGEQLFPGRPTDASGVKALAILAAKVYRTYRPGGIKAHCGALMLEEGLTEEDIKDMSDEGVWLIGEIGTSGLKDPVKVDALVQVARKYGFKVSVHFGPESLPGMSGLTNDDIINLQPDVICHFNGGPTACPFPEMKRMAERSSSFLELILNGNPRSLNYAVNLLRERAELGRIILGVDTPTGQGVMPRAIIRLVTQISSLNEIPAAAALCMATGNTARAFALKTGVVKPGWEADFLVMDAPIGSEGKNALAAIECGDQPTMGMVMVDGVVITRTMRKALNTAKKVLINGKEDTKKVTEEIFR
ncbi:MAG: amidohydrolase family protein [Thermodesulfobacteriota bacterium]